MGVKEAVFKKNALDGKYGEGGSVHDWQRVKSQFLEGFRLLRESFSIFSSFCL
jgi:hypothetical protein